MKKILWRCLEQLEHLRCSMPKFVIERRILVKKFLATRQCSFPLLFRILDCLDGFGLLRWLFPVEGLDWGF
jgi:hypothetical protein